MADAQDDFLIVTFPGNSSAAFEAYAKVKDVAGVTVAAVVSRDDKGQLSVPENTGDTSSGLWTGSAVGALIGILGGPLGVLLGWTAGAAIGSSYDAAGAVDDSDSLSVLSRAIQPGTDVLLVEAQETETSVLDTIVGQLGGQVLRTPATEVMAEVQQAREQQKSAQDAARKARREQRHDDFHQKVHGFFHHDSKS